MKAYADLLIAEDHSYQSGARNIGKLSLKINKAVA
jgi:hypothetical protein